MHSPTAVPSYSLQTRAAVLELLLSCTRAAVYPYSGCCTAVRTRAAVLGLLYPYSYWLGCRRADSKKSELIFSHSYNFYFGRESTLCATMGATAKFAHDTNPHKISYKLNA